MRDILFVIAIITNAMIGSLLIFLLPDRKPDTAEMTIKLNVETPIVTTGVLMITDTEGYRRVMTVEAGSTFILRSE